MIFIAAGNRDQAAHLAWRCSLTPRDWTYVRDDQSLRGHPRGSDMLLCGTYDQNPGVRRALQVARERDFKVAYIRSR